MAMDADLLAVLQSQSSDAFIMYEHDIGGTTKRYAPTWALSASGLVEGRWISGGSFNRSISDSGFSLPRDSATVTLDDDGREIEADIFAAGIQNITGTAARLKIVSPSVAESKWFTLFSGIIEDFSAPQALQWSFSLKRNDLALLGKVKIPFIQAYEWPNAPDASLGLPGQVVYGVHDSTGTDSTGMVPTVYVDNSGFRYLISAGTISSLDTVYVDGVESSSSNWALVSAVGDGGCYSLVDFTSDQGDAVVTVDCMGVSSGETNPATQLEHFLTNFVFGDWFGAQNYTSACPAYLTASNFNIDTDYFDEAEQFLADKQSTGGRVITSESTGLSVLEEWSQQLQIPAFWTYAGKIAVRPDDHTITDIYTTAAHFRQELSPEPESVSVQYNARELLSEVRTQYLYDHAAGQFRRQLTVKDPNAAVDSPATLNLNWRESAI